MGKRVDREGPIQRSVVEYLRQALPMAVVHHCKNEINKRGANIALELHRAKLAGAVKGFPDIIVLPFSVMGPIFFEVKAPGNYPDPDQRALHGVLRELGYPVAVVRSIDDVRTALTEWNVSTCERAVIIPMKGSVS